MTGNQSSETEETDEIQRVGERDVPEGDYSGDKPGQADSPPEYHGSWYRNETMREEVQMTVEGQVTWLREIDDKAMRTLRFNAVLVGLLVPAFSFAVKFGLVAEMKAFYTSHTAIGLTALIASTVLAGVTYTSSTIEAGVSSDDVRTAKRLGLTDEELHDVLLTSYARWIRSNRKTVRWNAVFITLTVFLTIAAFVFLTLGLASAILGSVPKFIEYGAYVGLFVVAILSGIV